MIITISSKWSSSPSTDNHKYLNIKFINSTKNSFLLQNQSFNFNLMINTILNGQPDLPKYIHFDLKGAPPQANKFYENFFNFIDKLQIGVKGILIEYEDTLPLQGRFANVSLD
jgi:hypothetical protein